MKKRNKGTLTKFDTIEISNSLRGEDKIGGDLGLM